MASGGHGYDPLSFGDVDAEADTSYLPSPSAPPAPHMQPAQTYTPSSASHSALVDVSLTSPSSMHFSSAPPAPTPMQGAAAAAATAAAATPQPHAPPSLPTSSLSAYPEIPSAPTFPTPSAPPAPSSSSWSPPPSLSLPDSSSGHTSTMGPTYTITVGQPVKVVGPTALPGIEGQYIVFPVHSTSTGPAGYPGPEGQVRRRFRDFVALSDLLALLYPGHMIPARPRRNAMEGRRMQVEVRFLEDRRLALERYLGRLAQHPAVRRSEALQVFLQQEGELRTSTAWRRLLPGAQAGAAAGGSFMRKTSSFFRMMVGQGATPTAHQVVASAHSPRDAFKTISEGIASLRGTLKTAAITPLEQQLRDEGYKVTEVQRLLTVLSVKAHVLSARAEDASVALAGLARAMQGLGSYQEVMGFSSGRAEAALSDGCLRVSKLGSLAAEHASRQLAQLDDYVHFMPVVQAALHHRESCLLMSLNLESDLARRRARLNAATANPAQFPKQQQLETEVSCLQGAVDAAHSEYSKAAEQNARDLVALKAGMRTDLAMMLREWALVQVASAQKEEQLWKGMLQEMGGVSQ